MSGDAMSDDKNSLALLKERRFGPYFLTQFLGAFNDNVFRWALTTLVTFKLTDASDMDTGTLVNLAGGLFILPFFLFSALAGQIADRQEKSALIRKIKTLEIAIMMVAAVGFFYQSVYLLLGVLFLMGTQSAFFGPVKYSLLPQHLADSELVGGNAMVELGTFLAILLGTIAGSSLINLNEIGEIVVSCTLVALAVCGYLASRMIPTAPSNSPDLRVSLNLFKQSWSIVQIARREQSVFYAIMGISWFWFLGATYLAQLPVLVRDNIGGNSDVFTLCLAAFSVGIGIGSILCEKLSDHRVEIGLVPFGSIGLTVFGLHLYTTIPAMPLITPEQALAEQFLTITEVISGMGISLFVDIVLIGIAGGFFIVPLYAVMQQRSDPTQRSRVIAANNIINALFMVLSAICAIAMLNAGLSVPLLLLVIAIMNIAVALFIYGLLPEFLLRFCAWILMTILYRVRKQGLQHVPDEGAAVLVCNHVSYIDALIIMASIRRPIRFVMYYKIFQIPLMGFLFKGANAIPIAGMKEDPAMLERAMSEIEQALAAGELVCIFPEGQLTGDGEINPFRSGIERIIETTPVPVIPMALRGLWGSLFTRKDGPAFVKLPRKLWARIELFISEAVPPQEVACERLQTTVSTLRGERK